VFSHLKFHLAVGWNKTAAESDKGMVVNPKLQVGTCLFSKFSEKQTRSKHQLSRLKYDTW
jgi:hypothetical protein